jgi:hypothetical protein
VRPGGERDDAVGDVVEQQAGQREVAEVVRADLRLEAVGGASLGDGHDAGVVDEQVEVALPGLGERADGREVREVEVAHLGRAGHRRRELLAAARVAHGEHDVGAHPGELARSDQADAAGRAGHHRGLAVEGGQVGGGPLRRAHALECRH